MNGHETCCDWPNWLTLGGHTVDLCAGSWPLALARVALCGAILMTYWVISRHWAQQETLLRPGPELRALRGMRLLFLTCGFAGYGSMVLLTWLPWWTVYVGILSANLLVAVRYAMRSSGMDVIYATLERAKRDELKRLACTMYQEDPTEEWAKHQLANYDKLLCELQMRSA